MFNPVWKLIPFDRALNCMQYIWIWQHSHTQHWRKLYFNSANCLIRGNSWWIWYFHIGVQMTYLFLHPIMHLLLFFSPDWVTFGHVIISRFFIYFLFHRPFYISIWIRSFVWIEGWLHGWMWAILTIVGSTSQWYILNFSWRCVFYNTRKNPSSPS